MVDAMVSFVLEQLISMALDEAKQQVKLVTGVGKEVENLKRNFRAIQAVLVDAERRQVKEESVRLWLDELKDASYDMEDVLDEWNTARLKLPIEGVDENALAPKTPVCSFFPLASCTGYKQISLRRDIAKKIKEMKENLDEIARHKDMLRLSDIRSNEEKSERIPSTSLIDVSEVRGRSSEQQNAVQVISLVGMGGIGKTTLAQFAYNDNDVINHFEKRIWVCVSDPFDEFRIAKAIIEALEGSTPSLGELNSLLERIYASIARKKFLLVLDDVWTEDHNKWETFQRCPKDGLRGSKILVTTRKMIVAQMMQLNDVILIQELSDQACWSLFEQLAFSGRPRSECEQLIEIGSKIVGKCKGLPLAAKTIGSLLRFKKTREQWQNILDSEIWQLEELEESLLAPLLLSYNDLPPKIKLCFSYCAVFPKDYSIEKDELIHLWMAQGYIRSKHNEELEMIGQEYFNFLASRCFFQEFEKDDMGIVIGCKMHDIIHDFAMHLTKNECFSAEVYDVDKISLSFMNTFQEKLRHLMLALGSSDASFSIDKLNAKKLRSLLIDSRLVHSSVLQGLFKQFTSLRALRISGWGWEIGIDEIPKEKLIHLRFLKLSWLRIKGMNHLRGLLKIRMLGDLANVDEAKHVDLKEKKNLDHLELWFDNVGMTDENEENDEAITKVLQLPPNLEYLGILHYRGRSLIFPNWIESFNKLKKLLFIDCKKCESMPPLGQLQSLEVLTIWNMASVKKVSDEFLGIENGHLHGTSSSSSSVTAFPKLKHLKINGWYKWEEWYVVKEDITIMPELNSLDICLCNNLKSLPDQILQSITVENLMIEKCPILEERFKKDTGEALSKISHIPNIRIGR